jgi:hypothetical protein
MLASGHPPNDWDALLKEAGQATQRLSQLANQLNQLP